MHRQTIMAAMDASRRQNVLAPSHGMKLGSSPARPARHVISFHSQDPAQTQQAQRLPTAAGNVGHPHAPNQHLQMLGNHGMK